MNTEWASQVTCFKWRRWGGWTQCEVVLPKGSLSLRKRWAVQRHIRLVHIALWWSESGVLFLQMKGLTRGLPYWQVDRLIDWWTGLLTSGLAGLLTFGLACRRVDWLTDIWAGLHLDWLADRWTELLTGRLNYWHGLAYWYLGWLACWQLDCLTDIWAGLLTFGLACRQLDWLTDRWVGLLIGGLDYWYLGWIAGIWTGLSTCGLPYWHLDWLVDWQTGLLSDGSLLSLWPSTILWRQAGGVEVKLHSF
jgi:hypothetical protein